MENAMISRRGAGYIKYGSGIVGPCSIFLSFYKKKNRLKLETMTRFDESSPSLVYNNETRQNRYIYIYIYIFYIDDPSIFKHGRKFSRLENGDGGNGSKRQWRAEGHRERETLAKDPKFPFLRSVKSGYRQLDPGGDSWRSWRSRGDGDTRRRRWPVLARGGVRAVRSGCTRREREKR